MTSRTRKAGGIVLCGGKSSRMGRPKLMLPFGDETMLGRVIRILREVVDPVVVVAAPQQEVPPLPNGVLLARDEQEGLGPLAGLAVGLATLKPHVEAAYASSCDVPLLQSGFVRRIVEMLGEHELAMPRDGHYHHPLAAVYRTELVDRVRSLLAASRLRPFFLVEESRSKLVDVDDLRVVDPDLLSLRNINTEKEYFHALAEAELDAPEDLPWPGPAT